MTWEPRTAQIGVVIPTSYRPGELQRCLKSITKQSLMPNEVVVVAPEDDVDSRDIARSYSEAFSVTVATPARSQSYVSACRAGILGARSDWVAFLDDDSVPEVKWIEKLAEHLGRDQRLGAVGGRILNIVDGKTTARNIEFQKVARITWCGKPVSYLHDIPVLRRVIDADFLPGSNMCYRRELVRDIDPLVDCGMAPGVEAELAYMVRRRGLRVLYDSEIVVYHYPAGRKIPYERTNRVRYAFEYGFVQTYVLLKNLPLFRKVAFFVYGLLVGQRVSPGIAFLPYFVLRRQSVNIYLHGLKGRLAGVWAYILHTFRFGPDLRMPSSEGRDAV